MIERVFRRIETHNFDIERTAARDTSLSAGGGRPLLVAINAVALQVASAIINPRRRHCRRRALEQRARAFITLAYSRPRLRCRRRRHRPRRHHHFERAARRSEGTKRSAREPIKT